MMLLLAIITGFILDLLLGDPRWLPHPICLIGKFISWIEKLLRSILDNREKDLLFGGFLLVVLVLIFSFCIPFLILLWIEKVSPWLAFVVEAIMCYQIFATRSLREESMKVYYALQKGKLKDARVKLSWIVGRDTQKLSAEEVTKGAIETVAENTADGIIAPMIFMFLGGAPLAFLYKGINTMDSMVGYKNNKYLYFGRTAAKLDDIANFVPARIAAFCMIVAAYILNLDVRQAWITFKRDRYNHSSPNSAMTESVTAGALNIQLGGGHFYFGKWVPKATIGDDIRPVEEEDIVQTNNLMYMTAVVSMAIFSLVYLIILFVM